MDNSGRQADETLPQRERSVGPMVLGRLDSSFLGMAAFLSEYVVRRGTPIPKLLYAFGMCLASTLVASQLLPSSPDA